MKTILKFVPVLLLLPILLVFSLLMWLRSGVDQPSAVNVQPNVVFNNTTETNIELSTIEVTQRPAAAPTQHNSHNKAVTVKPELLTWYESQPPVEPWSLYDDPDDKRFDLYAAKAREDILAFIDLVAFSDDDNPFLKWALDSEISVRDQDRLLEYLTVSDSIADVAYWKGLHRKYKQGFEEAYGYWKTNRPEDMPEGIMLTAMEFNFDESFSFARQFVVESDTKLQVFELLDIYDQPDLDQLATAAWKASDREFGQEENLEAAILAAKYAGDRDALYEISFIASEFPIVTKVEYYGRLIRSVIRINDLNNLSDAVRLLTYLPEEQRWELIE
jgi:hypothetical protein